MKNRKSNYDKSKELFIKHILEESSDPEGDIEELIDLLSDEHVNNILLDFEEAYIQSGRPIPFWMRETE